jgi:hypothetical protein
VPTRPTGIAYRVRHGIEHVGDVPSYSRRMDPTRWTTCSVRLVEGGTIPNGSYFLYTDEGKVLQLRSIEGKWQYLAVAA